MEKKTYKELVQLHQQGRITWTQFVEMGDYGDDYRQWCRDSVLDPDDDDNAQVFLEQTEARLMSDEIDPADYE